MSARERDRDEMPMDAVHDPGGRYEPPAQRDLLRRFCDLLIGDVVAYRGRVRTVRNAGVPRMNPADSVVQFEPEPGHEDEDVNPKTGEPRWYTHPVEARVRVLRSVWEAQR